MELAELEDDQKQLHIGRICRCCLNESFNMKSIFDTYLSDMLVSCANISISSNDGLPSLICFQCVQQVNRSYTFREQCERSDTMLRHWFQPTIAQSEIVEPIQSTQNEKAAASNQTDEVQFINVLLNCVNTTNNENSENSTIMLPIDEHNQIYLPDGKTVLLTESNGNPCIGSSALQLPLNIASNKCDCDSISSCDDVEDSNDFDNQEIAKHDDSFINAEFLNSKIPVIPDSYMELMDNFNEPQIQIKIPDTIMLDGELAENSLAKDNKIEEAIEQPTFICNICNKGFREKAALQKHRKIHFTRKQLSCQLCSKTFAQQSYLSKHLKRHTSDKKFMCTVCVATFKESNLLKIHMRIHTGEKPYNCTECDKSFIQSNQLETHKLIHGNSRPNVCEICEKCKSNYI